MSLNSEFARKRARARARARRCEEIAFHVVNGVFHRIATMVRVQLDERQWRRVEAILFLEQGAGRPARDNRNFIEAVLWWRRTGVPWRDLPEAFGPWKTVFNRFDRWSKNGKWDRIFRALQSDRDDEWHSIDSTINRAHQHAAGGKGGPQNRESVVRVVDCQPKSTWWSTLWGYRSLSRSAKVNDTTADLRRSL